MYISLIPDETFKHVVIAPLDAPDGAHYDTPLQCDRVYYAGTRGLCLTAASVPPGPALPRAIFDEHFASPLVPAHRPAEPDAGVAGRTPRRDHRVRARALLR